MLTINLFESPVKYNAATHSVPNLLETYFKIWFVSEEKKFFYKARKNDMLVFGICKESQIKYSQ